MTTTTLFLFIVLALIAFYFLLERRLRSIVKKNKADDTIIEWLKSQQDQVRQSNQNISQVLRQTDKNIQQVLQKSNQSINQRLDNAAEYISRVAKEVGQMSEIGRSMQELQEFLRSPKLRGNIGEEILKDLIGQMFPKNSFHLQYQFRSGEKVDAALKTEAGILPIDSKFPMENFRRMAKTKEESARKQYKRTFTNDVRKHIRDVSKKYVLPDEGTMDFALMYVPSEAVFYEIVNSPEITDYARSQRVYIVSPNTLYAHLQMILLSFEGKRIESQGRKVFQLLKAIQKDYTKTEENLSILGKHLNNAGAKMNDVFQSFIVLGHKISTANQLPKGQEPKEPAKIKEKAQTNQ